MPLPKRKYHKRGETVDGFLVCDHPLYTTWVNMMRRCYNENSAEFPRYGGRGIKVSERWHHFANFARDMGAKPSPEFTLERRDNNLGYSPINCVWASRSDQCVNRRRFKNNTTGHTGVTKVGEAYSARFDYEGERYEIGRYRTIDEAVDAREAFIALFKSNRAAAEIHAAREKISLKSSTGVRGVSRHPGGGFIVRATVNGERVYLGHFMQFEDAVNAKRRHDQERTR